MKRQLGAPVRFRELSEDLRGDLWDSLVGSFSRRTLWRQLWKGLWRDFTHPACRPLDASLHRSPRSAPLALGHLPGIEGQQHLFRRNVRGQLEQLDFLHNRITGSTRLTIQSLLTTLRPTHIGFINDDLWGPDAPTW